MRNNNLIIVLCVSVLFCFAACETQQLEKPQHPVVGSWRNSYSVVDRNYHSELIIDTVTYSATGDYSSVSGIYNAQEPHNLIGRRALATGTYEVNEDTLLIHVLRVVYSSRGKMDSCYQETEPYDLPVKYAISNDTMFQTIKVGENDLRTYIYIYLRIR